MYELESRFAIMGHGVLSGGFLALDLLARRVNLASTLNTPTLELVH